MRLSDRQNSPSIAITHRNLLLANCRKDSAPEQYEHAFGADHRGLNEQGIEREPEVHLGPSGIRRMSAKQRLIHSDAREETELFGGTAHR